MNKNYDIVIVGGSLIGLAMANCLKDLNLKIALIEKNNFLEINTKNYDGRTSFIGSKSKQILQSFGCFDSLEQNAGKIEKILAYEAPSDKKESLFFSTIFQDSLEMGYIIHNADLRSALYKGIQKTGIDIFENIQVDSFETSEDEVKLSLSNSQNITANFVVACDGKKSFFAQKLGFEKVFKDYNQKAIIFIIKHQVFHENTAIEKFTENGPIAILPLKSGHESGIVLTESTKKADELLTLSKKELEQFLHSKIGCLSGDIEIISKVSSYPLTLSYAKQCYKNNVLLIGDAFHAIHPIAGQGFNISLRDVFEAAKVIKNNVEIGLKINSKLSWQAFEKSRKLDLMLMIKSTNFLNQLFRIKNPAVKGLRMLGVKAFDKIPYIKNKVISYASKGV